MDKNEYLRILDDIGSDNNSCNGYCIYKEILKNMHMNPRILIQFKCIDKFKYEVSQNLGYDVGMDVAGTMWVEEGWAKIFSENYNKNLKVESLYQKIKDIKHQQ